MSSSDEGKDAHSSVLVKVAPWIFVVVLAYFTAAVYWIFQSFMWGYEITSRFPIYASLLKESWWIILFYSSELGGVVCTSLRFVAGVFALYSAILFFREGKSFTPRVKKNVCRVLAFEAGYYLALIPSVILGFVHPLFAEKLWYFDSTPGMPVLLVSGVACLFMVLAIPQALLRLRLRIVKDLPCEEIVKWVCITGVAYLFVVFWLNYALSWIATTVPWVERAQPGVSILFEPLSLISFAATIFGLLAIALSALFSALPYIRGQGASQSFKRVGAIMIAFGSYFILVTILYIVAGGYAGRPTVWHEMVVPHNPDLWCVTFFLLGLRLISMKSNERVTNFIRIRR
ncbi:MAG: hypothetical protein ACQXXG_00580 [Candidatus Bathyarchaeia archaeon]|nr:hypothetical protein [Candidatus Bathyarchaeota archaeon A05DMB-3]